MGPSIMLVVSRLAPASRCDGPWLPRPRPPSKAGGAAGTHIAMTTGRRLYDWIRRDPPGGEPGDGGALGDWGAPLDDMPPYPAAAALLVQVARRVSPRKALGPDG